MSKTIAGIPDYITREQYLDLFAACGVEPRQVVELRMAHDGIHVLVFALDEHGNRIAGRDGYEKHRIFIPVRDAGDQRTTRVKPVAN